MLILARGDLGHECAIEGCFQDGTWLLEILEGDEVGRLAPICEECMELHFFKVRPQ